MNSADKERFLKVLSLIESSGGKNTKHKPVHDSVHKGESAYGQYAFMPNTVREFENRRKNDNLPYDKILLSGNEQQIKQRLTENPELEKRILDDIYNRLDSRFGGDPEKMMYAYQYGHNLTPERIDSKIKEVKNSDRVRKMHMYNKDLDKDLENQHFKKIMGLFPKKENLVPIDDGDYLTEA